MQDSPFLTGIVEGFYGQQWSWSERLDYAPFLAHIKLNTYLYCPKGDPHLRKQWHSQWPPADLENLQSLAQACESHGVRWGVGLSPYKLYAAYGNSQRQQLEQRIHQINDLGGSLLAILFDDMPGEFGQLARRQAEIVDDICRWSNAGRILVCPTYYSFDPQLERYFGAMPQDYWQELGTEMPFEVDILWTGNAVCSTAIRCEDIEKIGQLLGRSPTLWDNYPVNDGATASNFLHLQPLSERDPGLRTTVRGHLCNPMNQAALSKLPLLSLAQLYDAEMESTPLSQLFSAEFAQNLVADRVEFQQQGLTGMTAETRRKHLQTYQNWDEPGAREVVRWLQNEYRFDPACLTD